MVNFKALKTIFYNIKTRLIDGRNCWLELTNDNVFYRLAYYLTGQ